MFLINRLFLAASTCLLLSNCQLINTSLRLAPLLMLAEENEAGGKALEVRGRQVNEKAEFGHLDNGAATSPALVFLH
jgi:hypothetical protein